jgi:hypothetical protein
MVDEDADPEASYRRGYAHGAKQLFDAVASALPSELVPKVRAVAEGGRVCLAPSQFARSRLDPSLHSAISSDSVRQHPAEVLFW